MAEPSTQLLDWDAIRIGDALPSYEYVLTQEMLDKYRQSVEDPGGTLSDYLGQGGHVELLPEVSRRRFRQRALHVLLLQPADPGDTAASQCLDRGQVHAPGQAVYRDRSGVGRRARAAYRPSHHS